MIRLTYKSNNGETLEAWMNPRHIVYVSGQVGNVNITPSTGVAMGHNFLGDPARIAAEVALWIGGEA